MAGDHKCPVCQATFTRPQHVARHMRSHTGDRPYKCQHCGDQFARSDLLSRHVNKCHPNEKPLVTSAPSRRKGSASASRATTSKQACDQCVQSSLPCDGANPCSKCVHRKTRCTYVKFHRQTAPMGPGHPTRPNGEPSSAIPSLSGLPSVPPSYRLSDTFLLGNGAVLNPSAINTSQLYGQQFAFPNNGQLYASGSFEPPLGRDSFENAADYSARYRAQADLLSRQGAIPGDSPNGGVRGSLPMLYADNQQQQAIASSARYPQQYEDLHLSRSNVDYGYNLDDKPSHPYGREEAEPYHEQSSHYADPNPYHRGLPAYTLEQHEHQRRPSTSDGGSTTSRSQPSSAASSSVHLPLPNDYHPSHLSNAYSQPSLDAQQQRPMTSSAQEHTSHYPPEGEGGFSSAFGLMSLDDPNVLAGIQGAPFFEHAMANGNWGGDGATPRAGPPGEKDPHSLPAPTPASVKELKDMWKQYMRTPLTGPMLGHSNSDQPPDGSPRSPRKERGLSRVASLPSVKTPSASASAYDPMRNGANSAAVAPPHGTVRTYNHPDDLRSYEQAVLARRTPLTLNLVPKRRGVPAGSVSSGSDDKSSSASPQHLGHPAPAAGPSNLSRPSSSSSTSSLAHAFVDGRGHTESPVPVGSSPVMPHDGTLRYLGLEEQRPSFKRLPSQTLGPEYAKRPAVGMLSSARDENTSRANDGRSGEGPHAMAPLPVSIQMKGGHSALGGHHQQRLVDRARRMSAPTPSGVRDTHGVPG